MLPILLLWLSSATCLTSFGNTACGYDCTSSRGDVACANTPFGRCVAYYGKVTCNDPPWWVIEAYGDATPTMECVTTQGTAACGYACTTSHGQAVCASTPAGNCMASLGRVRCDDPPAWAARVYARMATTGRRPRGAMPRMSCAATHGNIDCGYDCRTSLGQVRCAKTPWGRCEASFGRVTCFDPQPGPRRWRPR